MISVVGRIASRALLTGVLLAFAPFGLAQGVDCGQHSERLEKLICSDLDLQRAKQEAELRVNALASWSATPPAWRRAQHLWERESRVRCADVGCLRSVYERRNALLKVLHDTPTPVVPGRWTPVGPPLVIQQVDDTVLVRLPPLTLKQGLTLRVEWQVAAEDRARWSIHGPGGRLLCQPPDAREGYAARFSYRQSTQGVQWPRLQRDGQTPVFELFSFVAGRDVPLNEPVHCSFSIGETLVDNPSVISVWQSPVIQQNQ
jgi:uncharacterized protein